ncbi:MAG: serine hydroxymethyltransferase, partial [Planctomycetes bacterium]|nr:serine hydroxymethyltransferase [Planctomycetota bacterium]
EVTGQQAEDWLVEAGIVVNKNMIPFDERKATQTSGLRIGTPAVTTRGMKDDEMKTIAGMIDRVLRNGGDRDVIEAVRSEVLSLCEQFPLYG